MATREIKTRFRLEGEGEYTKAIRDAASAIKVLDSEQKLAQAQYRNTGDAQAYAAEQARILQEKITQQKAAVDAAERAMQQLAQNGVSKNDKTYQQWATRLNTAKTNLVNLETQLGSVDAALDTAEAEAGEANTALEGIGRQVNYAAAISAIDSITGTIEKGVKAAVRMGKALWDSSLDAGRWADNLKTAASQAGLDVETYQSWQYASRFIDTSVSDITGSIDKLTKSLGSESEDAAAYFNQLCVATRNADGTVRNSTAVFWDVIDALGGVEDATTRDIYAQQLLGRSYRAINPLVEAGSAAYKAMAEEGRAVAVVSAENVDALGAVDDAQQQLNAALDKAKFDTLAELAPTMQTVSEAMAKAVMGFNAFTQSEKGQAALERLNGALSGVISAFLGEDGGQGTFESIVNGASGAIEAFTQGLQWVENHGDTVKGIIIALAGAYGSLKVGKTVLTFMQLLNAMPLSKLTAVFGGGSAASGAASGAANAATGAGAAAAGGSLIGKAAGWLGRIGLTGAAVYGADKLWEEGLGQRSVLKDIGYAAGLYSYAPGSETGREIYDSIKAAVADGMDAAEFTRQKYGSAELGELYTDKTSAFSRYEANGWKVSDESYSNFYKQLEDKLTEIESAAAQSGADAAQALSDAIQEGAPEAQQSSEGMADAAKGPVRDLQIDFEAFGQNASAGLADGIAEEAGLVYAEAWRVVDGVNNIFRSGLGIHSPSRVMMRIGGYIGQGLAQGIEDSTRLVERATGRMSAAVTRGAALPSGEIPAGGAPGQGGAPGAGGQAAGQPINATIMMDKTVVGRMVAPAVNAAIGAIVQNAR